MQRRPQVGLRIGKFWLVVNRPPIAIDRFSKFALRLKRIAAVVITMRIATSLVHSTQLGPRERSMLGQRNEFVVARNSAVLLPAPFHFRVFDTLARARDEVPPNEALAIGLRAADQHEVRRAPRGDAHR